MAEPRSLNDCAAFLTQASLVSAQPVDQSRVVILKGMINLAPKIR